MSETSDLPSVRDSIRKAKEWGRDSLGVTSDPESLVAVARMSAERYYEAGSPGALRSWFASVRLLREKFGAFWSN